MSSSPTLAPVVARPSFWQSNLFVPAAATLIVLATAACYGNSFAGAFVFDDHQYIEACSYITGLWPPWQALFKVTDVSRPLIGYSLAVNYRLSGDSTWSYHAMNLLIHCVAALALFGLVRRTLQSPRLAPRYNEKAGALALVIALVWAVHPLQTQAVTYVIQRCESLMGMCYMLTAYFAVRSFTASRRSWWVTAAALACVAGMLSKQVMVTAPLMVFLFDYLFFSGSVVAALRRQWPLYAGLALGWVALACVMAASPASETAGFSVKSISPFEYLISEFSVICHYVRLAFVPAPLVFDYDWPKAASLMAALPYAVPVVSGVALTAYGLYKRAGAAILGAWFFLILSVTSSVLPLEDLACEHRMYLPLAAIVSGCAIGGVELWRRLLAARLAKSGTQLSGGSLAFTLAAAFILIFGSLTVARNKDYESDVGLWADTVVKRPKNVRARNNFGRLLQEQGRLQEAMAQYSEAILLRPTYAQAYSNRGAVYKDLGDLEQAEQDLNVALRLNPASAEAHNNLGTVLVLRRDIQASETHFRRALELKPKFTQARLNLAAALVIGGRFAEAQAEAEQVLQRAPELAEAHFVLAVADESLGDVAGAEDHFVRAVALKNEYDVAQARLCRLLRRLGRNSEAQCEKEAERVR